MRGSLKIGTFAGIGVFVHWTFFLLFIYIGFISWGAGPAGFAIATVFVLALFFCVVLHEFGHALSARRYGIPTRDITLLPIGGVARLERMPEEPRQELVVALAGPAVNVVIAAALMGYLYLAHGRVPAYAVPADDPTLIGMIMHMGFVGFLAWVNIILVIFNMLPAFPMDGGRVLRALLGYRLDYATATRIAAAIGQGMAILFFFAGLVLNPILLIIAIFVFLGASAESQLADLRWGLSGIRVRDAMLTDFTTLTADDTLGDAVDRLLDGSQQDFAVMEGERIIGVLSRRDLLTALGAKGPSLRVEEAMRRDCGSVDENDVLFRVFQRMQEKDCPIVPVTRRGQVVGMMTLENIGELMMVRSALRQASQATADRRSGGWGDQSA